MPTLHGSEILKQMELAFEFQPRGERGASALQTCRKGSYVQ